MDLKVQKYYCELFTELDDFVFAVDVLHDTEFGNIDSLKLDVKNRLDKVNLILNSLDDETKNLSPSEYIEFHDMCKFVVNSFFVGLDLDEKLYNKFREPFQKTLDTFNDCFDVEDYYLSLIENNRLN